MAKVLVTRRIPGNALKRLEEAFDCVVSQFDRALTAQEMIEMGREAEGILTLLTDKWTGELMDKFPNLKILSNYAVGFDNIDIDAATKREIMVCNTPSEEVNEAVAEFAWSLILSLSRRVVEADEFSRKGAYHGWEPDVFLGRDVYGKTLGIVGLGRIGAMVARRAKGFNMNVLYYNRSRNEEVEKETGAKMHPIEHVLGESDYVTIHLPLTEETRHLINSEKIGFMKSTAYLINTARGAVVDEHALVEALHTGKIAGAALDVHENEPQMNPEMMQMENVILTPHIASATIEVREKMGEQAVDAILKALKGEKSENLVNPEVWPTLHLADISSRTFSSR
ncbi:MAG: D-glycerate dehydrogenase [Patescibacteria group bacterium]